MRASGVKRGIELRMSVFSKVVFSSIFPVRKPFAQRAEWNKADAKFLKCRNDFGLRGSVPERVLTLHGGDGLHGVSAADRLRAGFRQAEVLDLALSNQFLHRSSYVFDGHLRVNAVLIVEIDDVGLQALERAFDRPA